MRRAVHWAVLAVLLIVTVAGCTGIPTSSAPAVVRTVGLGESAPPSAPAPPAGAGQRAIVQGFIDAMRSSPDRLDAAKAFLDTEAVQSWNPSTVTVVSNQYQVGSEQANNTVKVSFQSVGTIAANGVYTPATFAGNGTAAKQPVTYTLAKNPSGQWRIHPSVPLGLYVTETDFRSLFTPKALYYFDNSGTRLVPDLRYSPLGEPTVESFLLTQLSTGPRSNLDRAVTSFMPAAAGNQRLSVTQGNPTIVQIPGAAALDGDALTRLAAQVAFTLKPTSFQTELQIQDGTRVVEIPNVGTEFDFSEFAQFAPVDEDTPTVTYVRGGAVVGADGKPVLGKVGTDAFDLDSAVFDSDGGRTLVAGTTGPDDGARQLLVGDTTELKDVGVPAGPLTAPVWAPVGSGADVDEVWVASGSRIYRFVPGVVGARPTRVDFAGPSTIAGTVTALAFSPEGTRLALVVRLPGGASQLQVATVARNGPDVNITALTPVTPEAYQLSGVGWRSETTLAAVGVSAGFAAGVYLEVGVDGSLLDPESPDGLPGQPRSIATSPRATTQWVTVGTGSDAEVWTKSTSVRSWAAPADGSTQAGSAPSFSS